MLSWTKICYAKIILLMDPANERQRWETSWYPWNHGFHGIYPFIKTQDRDLGWACFICWSGSGYADSISWCSVIACPDWVHMFRGCAHMREAIEDHQGILVRTSQFPIDATQPSLNLRSKSESSCIFIAFVFFFVKNKKTKQNSKRCQI